MNELLLNILNKLGIDQRKLLRGQNKCTILQEDLMSAQNELAGKQKELLTMQYELLQMVKAVASRIAPDDLLNTEEVWLTRMRVQEMLYLTRSTFYRRLAVEKWKRKRNGGSWLYLKSSVLGLD